jgi:hypothetical protein
MAFYFIIIFLMGLCKPVCGRARGSGNEFMEKKGGGDPQNLGNDWSNFFYPFLFAICKNTLSK